MMTFYSAIGSYRIKNQNGRKMPYIQRLGKLHPISIPEFVIWSTLLWEVLTYDELKRYYDRQMKMLEGEKPNFDQLLDLLVNYFQKERFTVFSARDGEEAVTLRHRLLAVVRHCSVRGQLLHRVLHHVAARHGEDRTADRAVKHLAIGVVVHDLPAR